MYFVKSFVLLEDYLINLLRFAVHLSLHFVLRSEKETGLHTSTASSECYFTYVPCRLALFSCIAYCTTGFS